MKYRNSIIINLNGVDTKFNISVNNNNITHIKSKDIDIVLNGEYELSNLWCILDYMTNDEFIETSGSIDELILDEILQYKICYEYIIIYINNNILKIDKNVGNKFKYILNEAIQEVRYI